MPLVRVLGQLFDALVGPLDLRGRLRVRTVLFSLALLVQTVGVASAKLDISGEWTIRHERFGSTEGTIQIGRDGSRIEVTGQTRMGAKCSGQGTFDGERGFYEWGCGGSPGRTELVLDESGVLHGHSVSSTSNWKWIGTRVAAPAEQKPGERKPKSSRGEEWVSKLRSGDGRAATTIVFQNESAVAVEVLWVDWQGVEKLYRTLDPGSSYQQSTYVTHVWLIRATRSREAIDSIVAEDAPKTVRIAGDPLRVESGTALAGAPRRVETAPTAPSGGPQASGPAAGPVARTDTPASPTEAAKEGAPGPAEGAKTAQSGGVSRQEAALPPSGGAQAGEPTRGSRRVTGRPTLVQSFQNWLVSWQGVIVPLLGVGIIAAVWAYSAKVATYLAGLFLVSGAAWFAGFPGILISFPLAVGGVVAFAKPAFAPRWVERLEGWMAAKRSAVESRTGYVSRWLFRPWLHGIEKIRVWTASIEDEHIRCGTRAASYLYFSSAVVLAAYFAFLVVMAVVLLVIGFWIVMWLLGVVFGDDERDEVRRRVTVESPQSEASGRQAEAQDADADYGDKWFPMGQGTWSQERRGPFGDTYIQHCDKAGKGIVRTEKRSRLGGDYWEHIGPDGKTGYSYPRTGPLGDSYMEHKSLDGSPQGSSHRTRGPLGDERIEHRRPDHSLAITSTRQTDTSGKDYWSHG